jgi:hypothetical protein
MVNKLINLQATDGGKNRIPALTYKAGNEERKASSNGEKGTVLAKNFFPDRPPTPGQVESTEYSPCCTADRINKEQIGRQLQRLKPYKAPGPDGIPNIVLSKCANLLIDRLLAIYLRSTKRISSTIPGNASPPSCSANQANHATTYLNHTGR